MKTNVSHSDSQKADKSEASKQASAETILQAYKTGTSQLQTAEEEPVQPKENKTGLPDNLKSGVENLSGHSLDDVKVHYNSSQPASLQAHAYAQGTDIHVAPGQEKHLPHEAWHVVQQKEGRVQPTKQLKGTTNINDDAGLEKEADVMGAKALSAVNYGSQIIQQKAIAPSLLTIQLHKGENEQDPQLDDMCIYAVIKKSDDSIVYIGQTEANIGIDARFEQHLKNPSHSNWSKATHKIKLLENENWTRFETSCAEQYWIDLNGGVDQLENARNQISKSHFLEMIQWQETNNIIVFRGETAKFPKGWKPAK